MSFLIGLETERSLCRKWRKITVRCKPQLPYVLNGKAAGEYDDIILCSLMMKELVCGNSFCGDKIPDKCMGFFLLQKLWDKWEMGLLRRPGKSCEGQFCGLLPQVGQGLWEAVSRLECVIQELLKTAISGG